MEKIGLIFFVLSILLLGCNFVEVKLTQHVVMDKGDNTKDNVTEGKDAIEEAIKLDVEAGL